MLRLLAQSKSVPVYLYTLRGYLILTPTGPYPKRTLPSFSTVRHQRFLKPGHGLRAMSAYEALWWEEDYREELFNDAFRAIRRPSYTDEDIRYRLANMGMPYPVPDKLGFKYTRYQANWAVVVDAWLIAPLTGLGLIPLAMAIWRTEVVRRRVRSQRCGVCNYPIHSLPVPRCPECGADWSRGAPLFWGRRRALD